MNLGFDTFGIRLGMTEEELEKACSEIGYQLEHENDNYFIMGKPDTCDDCSMVNFEFKDNTVSCISINYWKEFFTNIEDVEFMEYDELIKYFFNRILNESMDGTEELNVIPADSFMLFECKEWKVIFNYKSEEIDIIGKM